MRACRGYGPATSETIRYQKGLGSPAREGESPVRESDSQRAGSKVPRDTRNLVGSRGDPPPKAKYSLVTDSA